MEARGNEEIGTHRQYLFYSALRRLRDRNLAEDAVQDTFLAALANQAIFAGKSTRKTWLTGILNHKVCDQLRKSSQSHALLESLSLANGKEIDLPISSSMGRHCRDPRMELEFKEFGMALVEALQKLPPRMAMVYELHEFVGADSAAS